MAMRDDQDTLKWSGALNSSRIPLRWFELYLTEYRLSDLGENPAFFAFPLEAIDPG